jgi:UPF0755 protein
MFFKMVRIIFLSGIAAFLLFIVIAISSGPLKQEKLVVLNRGSTKNVARILQQEGVIYNAKVFWIFAQVGKFFGPIKAGEYVFAPHISNFDIIRKMQQEDVFVRKMTIPEGYTTAQIINALKKEEKLSGDINENYEEGDLLPETYFYIYGETKSQMLDKMAVSMREILDDLWKKRNKEVQLKSKKEALVLASIVEKESKLDEDRPKIASVFLNRLKKGMKLEADPTTIYAITKGAYVLERPLTKKDLRIDSPFNTYKYKGLPSTPIANPGIESLIAVLNPIETNYLYFVVADCEGRHNFSSNMQQHNKNVAIYRKLRCS